MDDYQLVCALRAREEGAFESLMDRYYAPMLRLAERFVRSREEAEEVVQDTWMAVLTGLDRFEGRSSLRTWIFRILVNRARTRARRESRQLPFSQLGANLVPASETDGAWYEPLLSSEPRDPTEWHLRGRPIPGPDEYVLQDELAGRIDAAVEELPERQKEVIRLRDLEGWTPGEVCRELEISAANQRVLLHRARLRVRERLSDYIDPPSPRMRVATASVG